MRDDEGCLGNPPCQPASAYFSPLSRSIQHPPASSRTKRTPPPSLSLSSFPPLLVRPPVPSRHIIPPRFSRNLSPLLLLLTWPLHVRITVDHHKPTLSRSSPNPPFFLAFRHLALPLSLRLSSDVSLRRSLSFPSHSFLIFLYEFVLKISFYHL